MSFLQLTTLFTITHCLIEAHLLDIHEKSIEHKWEHINIIGTNYTSEIYGKKISYKISSNGLWFTTPCTVIGNENDGLLGTYKILYDNSLKYKNNKRRRLNPFDGQNKGTWINGIIPVDYDTYGDAFPKDIFDEMVKQYFEKTGIKIIKRTNETDYIQIINDSGCWSYVGRTGGKQSLSLNYPGCLFLTTMTHEFMHALGIEHTQQRQDRDKYVKVNFENIIPENIGANFDKSLRDVCGVYDCRSVMHYETKAFSKNDLETITPLNKSECIIARNPITPLTKNDANCVRNMYFNGANGDVSYTPTINYYTPTMSPSLNNKILTNNSCDLNENNKDGWRFYNAKLLESENCPRYQNSSNNYTYKYCAKFNNAGQIYKKYDFTNKYYIQIKFDVHSFVVNNSNIDNYWDPYTYLIHYDCSNTGFKFLKYATDYYLRPHGVYLEDTVKLPNECNNNNNVWIRFWNYFYTDVADKLNIYIGNICVNYNTISKIPTVSPTKYPTLISKQPTTNIPTLISKIPSMSPTIEPTYMTRIPTKMPSVYKNDTCQLIGINGDDNWSKNDAQYVNSVNCPYNHQYCLLFAEYDYAYKIFSTLNQYNIQFSFDISLVGGTITNSESFDVDIACDGDNNYSNLQVYNISDIFKDNRNASVSFSIPSRCENNNQMYILIYNSNINPSKTLYVSNICKKYDSVSSAPTLAPTLEPDNCDIKSNILDNNWNMVNSHLISSTNCPKYSAGQQYCIRMDSFSNISTTYNMINKYDIQISFDIELDDNPLDYREYFSFHYNCKNMSIDDTLIEGINYNTDYFNKHYGMTKNTNISLPNECNNNPNVFILFKLYATIESVYIGNVCILFNTMSPTAVTVTPTMIPTETPTNAPTDTPTNTPTNTPTDAPTNVPTGTPTNIPSKIPVYMTTINANNNPTTVVGGGNKRLTNGGIAGIVTSIVIVIIIIIVVLIGLKIKSGKSPDQTLNVKKSIEMNKEIEKTNDGVTPDKNETNDIVNTFVDNQTNGE